MARERKIDYKAVKKKYGVRDLYSWSKYNTMETDWFSYFLRYVIKAKEDRADSIFSPGGSLVHSLLEKLYLSEITLEEAISEYEYKMFELETLGYKFDRTDKNKNDAIKAKYHFDNEHFLRHFKIQDNMKDVEIEKGLTVKVGRFAFIGYSDMEHVEEKNGRHIKYITDFKTSTIYKGVKIEKERGQLLLYALSNMQEGWNIEDIVIRWMFTKYCTFNIHKTDEKGNSKIISRDIERCKIGESLSCEVKNKLGKVRVFSDSYIDDIEKNIIENKSIPKQLLEVLPEHLLEIQVTAKGDVKKNYISTIKKTLKSIKKYNSEEIERFIQQMIITNSLNMLPDCVLNDFEMENCYVEIPFNQDDIKDLQVKIITKLHEAIKKTNEYEKTKDIKIWYQDDDHYKNNEYFFNVLSGYSINKLKPYKEYLDRKKNKDELKEQEEKDGYDSIDDMLEDLGIEV